MVSTRMPPRLHVLLAADRPIGVVIRRGPAREVATILWDRRHDTFELGQWLRGRIYERRADLAPDGHFMIYFAMNGRWHGKARGAWTAISVAPYLKASALFAKGDCWQGGGLWVGKRRFWLNGGHETIATLGSLRRETEWRPEGSYGAECLSVYYPRLLRDGWTLVARTKVEQAKQHRIDTFDKRLDDGWTLRKLAHAQMRPPLGKGCYWDEHELVHVDGRTIREPRWEWAERDRHRLVWAQNGCLFAATLGAEGLSRKKLLADFSPMTFEARRAPY